MIYLLWYNALLSLIAEIEFMQRRTVGQAGNVKCIIYKICYIYLLSYNYEIQCIII